MSASKDLKNLDRVLSEAISGSSKAAEAVRKIRSQGYAVYLAIDRKDDDQRLQIELTSGQKKASAKQRFLLNKGDVSFLESVGIDATRPGRRRRAP